MITPYDDRFVVEVPGEYQKEAYSKLVERVENGEDLLTVLGMRKEAEYYANKILKGLCKIDNILYERITGKHYELPYLCLGIKTCIRCGKPMYYRSRGDVCHDCLFDNQSDWSKIARAENRDRRRLALCK